MFPAQRRALIIQHLRQEEAASLRDLAARIGISLSTVRRDIDYLCETGHLQRTHGGAILQANERRGFEPETAIAAALFPAQKQAIGQRAASLIHPGQSVVFDSGTTTAAAALAAGARAIHFTAITNDLRIGAILSDSSQISTTVTGGQVRPGSPTLLGAATAGLLSRLHADIAFIGTHAIAPDADGVLHLSDTSPELAEIKRIIMQSADFVVLLADSSKFSESAFCRFGALADVDQVITDSRISPAYGQTIQADGVRLEIADDA